MNLGLLDILTVQQAAKSKYDAAFDDAPAAGREAFAEYVVDPVTAGSGVDVRYTGRQAVTGVRPDSSQGDIAASASVSVSGQGVVTGADSPALKEFSANPVVAFLASQLNGQQLDEVTGDIIGDGGSLDVARVVDAILAQYGDELADEDVSGAIVEYIQNYLAQADQGQASVPADVRAVLEGIVKNLSEAAGEPVQLVSAQTKNISAFGTASDSEISRVVNALAGKIIEEATLAAGKPEVSGVALQSAQASVLLGTDRKPDGSARPPVQPGVNAIEAQLRSDTAVQLTGEEGGQSQKQQAGSGNTQQSGAMTLTNQSADAAQQSAFKVNAEVPKSSAEVLVSSQGSQGVVSGDMAKLGEYLNVTQAGTGNATASRTGDAQDVLAQIKFGTAALAAKGGRSISIQLYPKELGNVDIRMELGSEGKTRVTIIAEKTDTMNLLQKEAVTLRNILQDALKTDPTNLSFAFHDKSDENWRQFAQDGSGSHYAEAGEVEENALMNEPMLYGGGYVVLSEGLNIRV